MANTFANVPINLYCQQFNILLSAFNNRTCSSPVHSDSAVNSSSFAFWQLHQALHMSPLAPSLPAYTSFVSRTAMVHLFSTYHCSPLTEPSSLTHLSDFQTIILISGPYVSQMLPMHTNRYFIEILQILVKRFWLWSVLKISSLQKSIMLSAETTTNIHSWYTGWFHHLLIPSLTPILCLINRQIPSFEGRYLFLCVWAGFDVMRSYWRIGNRGAIIKQSLLKIINGLWVSMAKAKQ